MKKIMLFISWLWVSIYPLHSIGTNN